MRTVIAIIVAVVVIGLIIWAVSARGNKAATKTAATQSPVSAEISPGASPETGQEVSIQNFSFNPNKLEVSKGMTVIWFNDDSVDHTVTSDDGGPLNSPTIKPGDSFEFTFDNAGTFAYHCSIHPNMKAEVDVK